MQTKRYRDFHRLETFEDRFDYLMLAGQVGAATFGFDRDINQKFYRSVEWKRTRDFVITRDEGCDLGIPGFEIHSNILIHHINPMDIDDIVRGDDWILNPEFLITTTQRTHNAIHFGNKETLPKPYVARTRGDTKLW